MVWCSLVFVLFDLVLIVSFCLLLVVFVVFCRAALVGLRGYLLVLDSCWARTVVVVLVCLHMFVSWVYYWFIMFGWLLVV